MKGEPVKVGVRDLKDSLSAYLRRARAGEHIVVTERGRPVAKLVPPDLPEGLARLIAEGRLVPARSPRRLDRVRPALGARAGRQVLEQLLADRHS